MSKSASVWKRGLSLSSASQSFALWPYLILAALVRYLLIPLQGGFAQDRTVIQGWARTMDGLPLTSFYSSAPNPDHLPGDLLLLKLAQLCYSGLGLDSYGESFDWFARALPVTADLIVALLLFSVLKKLGLPRAGRVGALLYLFLPVAPILSGYWTAYDSISLALLLGVARLALETSWRAGASIGLLSSWALLIKPQLVVPLLPLVLLFFLTQPLLARVKSFAAFLFAGFSWAVVVCGLFGLGLFWDMSQGSLLDRYAYAAELWPYSANNSPNIWAWANIDAKDSESVFDVSHLTIGTTLVVMAALFILFAVAKMRHVWPHASLALWASASLYFSLFMFATRMHGRYVLPAFALLLLTACLLNARRLWLALGLLLIGFLIGFTYGLSHEWDYTALRVSSIFLLASLLMLLSLPWVHDISPRTEKEVAS